MSVFIRSSPERSRNKPGKNVRSSVRPYVHKLNAATNHDDVTFKVIRCQGQGHVRRKVSKMTIFKFYLLRHFSTNQKNFNGF